MRLPDDNLLINQHIVFFLLHEQTGEHSSSTGPFLSLGFRNKEPPGQSAGSQIGIVDVKPVPNATSSK